MKKKYLVGGSYTILASLWWGVIGVIYFNFVSFANPIELTIHRTIWTAFLLILTTSLYSKWSEFVDIVRVKTNVIILFITGLLIMTNWLTWIYAVSVNRLIDSALGYYIYPIFSVFFGIIFLKEKYNKNKIISIILVFISIVYLLIYYKTLPWIGLTVAITFSLYTLVRKKINVSSDIGLLIETLLLTPFCILAFFILTKKGINIFSITNPILSFYLFWAGLMTLIPLYWYTRGFGLLGIGPSSMIFFITPTSQFILGIFFFGEILDLHKLGCFVIIWIAVIIYLNELRKE
jgi:chloramphenicol-sensitive protein RarD|tara:strand:- start:1697 stop:2569 length:873 start_codon:yes stop_codon:yes gene_type:complete